MSSGSICALLCAYFCFFVVPFIFQSVGLFTPKWASNATCDSIGLMYSCCTGNNTEACQTTNGRNMLDAWALGLHTMSFVFMVLAMLVSFCGVSSACGMCHRCYDKNEGFGVKTARQICDKLFGVILHLVAFLLFVIAGLFSVIGCILVSTKFSTSQLGYSFYLSLIAGCFIILLIIVLCFMGCKNDQSDNESLSGTDSPLDSSIGTASRPGVFTFMKKSAVEKLLQSSRRNRPS